MSKSRCRTEDDNAPCVARARGDKESTQAGGAVLWPVLQYCARLSLSREYNMSRERVLRDIERGAVSLLYISFMISHFLDISSSHFT